MNDSLLKDVIADLYDTPEKARALAKASGLPARFIRLWDTPHANANNIVDAARNNGNVSGLLKALYYEHPENPYALTLSMGLTPSVGPDIRTKWRAPQEVITGDRSTLRPITWLEDGAKVANAVVRVVVGRNEGLATGFVTDGLFLVTNNHVINSKEVAAKATAQFDYTYHKKYVDMRLAPENGFITDEASDLTVCAMRGTVPETSDFQFHRIGTPLVGHYCQIIQHPAGQYKQIGVYNNRITFVDSQRVQYLTDTMPGSSGSPVFDEDWNLIAIHSSGGWMRVGDERGSMGYANQGTPVSALTKMLEELYGKSAPRLPG